METVSVSVMRSAVTGVGGYLPDQVVTNDDLAKFVDTSDEWIVERTGIRQRHKARRRPADLRPGRRGRPAGAGRRRARRAADVDLIIVATTTPGPDLPGRRLHRAAQAGRAGRHRLRRPGGVLGLRLCAERRRRLRGARAWPNAPWSSAPRTMTRLMDWTDRGTCVLFGDGAGAVVLEPREGQGTTADRGLLGFALRCDGTKHGPALCRRRPVHHRHGRQAAHAGQPGVPPRRGQHLRGRRPPPPPPRASRSPTSTGSSRTRPTSASSRAWPTGWASTRTR